MNDDPPPSFDFPDDTPAPAHNRRAHRVGHSIRAAVKDAQPKTKAQSIGAIALVITAIGGGTGISALVSAFTGTKEMGAKIDRLSVQVAKLDRLASEVEQMREEAKARSQKIDAHENRQDANIHHIAKLGYMLNGKSPAYGWPKPDPDNWETATSGKSFYSREAWKMDQN